MERIQVLIDKLQQQSKQQESASSMLVTINLLQNELMALQNTSKTLGTSKVSVVMPYSSVSNGRNIDERFTEQEITYPAKPVPNVESKPEKAPLVANVKPVEKEYQLPKTSVPGVLKETTKQPIPVYDHYQEAALEAPTLLQQQVYKEVHELISSQEESLNDRLKQDKKELAHVLKEAPVKDLRKAIGVNDKFVFISELFRGDEQSYERSIKTINTFHILPEAEYWINRELKVKLGWNDTNDVVQHFYQLVRRRFS